MANINIENISELDLNGNDLFGDSESFMTEVSDDGEQEFIMGGLVGSDTDACWIYEPVRATCNGGH